MGCGSSVEHVKTAERVNWSGDLTVDIVEASLYEDVAWIGKQQPYVVVRFGKKVSKSHVDEQGGQFPRWNETFKFRRNTEDDFVHVEVWNKNVITSDDLLAEGGFSLLRARTPRPEKKAVTCTLYGDGKKKGDLKAVLTFGVDPQHQRHPEFVAPDEIGKLRVVVKEATLKEEVLDESSLKPIVLLRLGEEKAFTQAVTKNTLHPYWGEQLVLTRDIRENDTVVFELRNFQKAIDNSKTLAVGFLSITPALLPQHQAAIVTLYKQGKDAGYIKVDYFLERTPNGQGMAPGNPYSGGGGPAPSQYYAPPPQQQQQQFVQYVAAPPFPHGAQQVNYQVPVLPLLPPPNPLGHGAPQQVAFVAVPQQQFFQQPPPQQQQQQQFYAVPPPPRVILQSGTDQVFEGGAVVFSNSGWFFTSVLPNCNWCVFRATQPFTQDNAEPLWVTGTTNQGIAPCKLTISTSGQLVLLDLAKKTLWTSQQKVQGNGPFRLCLRDDGILSVFDANNAVVWSPV